MAVVTTNLGTVTAYGDAVAAGYTGTKEEWQALMASYATVGQQAVDAKNAAVAAKDTAVAKATEATTAASTATTKANEASASAQSIAQSAAQIQENTDDIDQLKSDLKNYNAVNVLAYGEQVTKTHNNVTFTWTDKAHCNVKCTASSHSVGLCNLFYSVSSLPSVFEKGTRYYFKYTTTQASGQRCLCDIWIFRNGNTNVNSPDVVFNVNNDIEFIMPNDATGIVIRLRLLANYIVDENINIALLSAKTNVELEKEVISAASNFGLSNYTFESGTHNGITYTWNSDNNRCHVTGTASANSFRNVYYSTSELPLGINAGDKIGVLFNTTDEHIACRITYQLGSGYSYSPYITEPTILTIPSDAVGMFLRLTVINGYTVDGYATVPLIFKANLQAEKIPFKAKKPLLVSFIDDDTSTDDLVTKFYQNCKHNGIVGSFAVCTKQYTDNTSTISQLLGYEYDGFCEFDFGSLFHGLCLCGMQCAASVSPSEKGEPLLAERGVHLR